MGVCNCSMFCCMLFYVHSSIAIILMGKRELVALLDLSSWCLVMVERPFLQVPRGCLRFVIVVYPDHTHLLFFYRYCCIFVMFTCFCVVVCDISTIFATIISPLMKNYRIDFILFSVFSSLL